MRAIFAAAITGCIFAHGFAWGQYDTMRRPNPPPGPNSIPPPGDRPGTNNYEATANRSFAPGVPQGIPWLDSLDKAMAFARTEQKPILVHYWNTSCAPCLRLEQTSFRDPGIIRLMATTYIPVKLNTDLPQNLELAKQMRVPNWPHDVILSPDGREIAKFNTPQDALQYGLQLERIAADFKARSAAATLARNTWPTSSPNPPPQPSPYSPPVTNNVPPWGNDPRFAADSRYSVPTQPRYGDMPTGGPEFPAPQETRNPYDNAPPARNTYDNSPPPSNYALPAAPATPPAVFDGNCPVTLIERKGWKKGDPQWGATHRGRTYLFASQAEQQKFLASPDRFAPMLSGYDPVVFVEQGKLVDGKREHGLFIQESVYLFASEDTLARFQATPGKFVPAVKQAMTDRR